jgi:hypothetical protein
MEYVYERTTVKEPNKTTETKKFRFKLSLASIIGFFFK